jgi:enoyl-CoA hydratase
VAHECFDLEVANGIAHIRLSRPDALNTFVRAFWRELPEAVAELDRSAAARVIVVSSTGRHFTAGIDLGVFQAFGPASGAEPGRTRAALMRTVEAMQETFTCLDRARMPVIAAIQGGCIGAGVDMVSACDMRYCTVDAFFSIHEINIGMTADVGTFPRLPHLIPQGMVREMAYTGRRLSAARAREIGLVNDVYDTHEAMMAAVMATAAEIAARSPLAVWGSKEMINYARDHTIADGLRHIATWQAGMFHEPDLKEGLTAQAEKRQPRYDDLLPARDVI